MGNTRRALCPHGGASLFPWLLPHGCQRLRESSSAWPKATWKILLQLQFASPPPCLCADQANGGGLVHGPPGLFPQAMAVTAVTSERGPTHTSREWASATPDCQGAGTEDPSWSRAAELKAGGRWQPRWDPLSLRQPLLLTHKSDAEQPSRTKEVGGSQTRETEGGARQEWERSCADKKEGRETHTHTQIRERERQGDNKGGRDHMGEGVPHLVRSPSTLLLSLFACPVQGHQSRASELWVERPYPRGFSCSPRFCVVTGEAVISRSAKGPGVTG